MAQVVIPSPVETRRLNERIRGWLQNRQHWVAWALAILLVLILRLSTPLARLMTDGAEYLKVANAGLQPEAQLGAPFVYRFAVPLLVHGISLATGAQPLFIFPVVVFVTCVLLLMAVYALALKAGTTRNGALLIMVLLASSVFMIRFPLFCPYDVDVEACLVSFVAIAFLLRRSYAAALVVSLIGLLFKEFLLAPLVVLAGLFFRQYVREKTDGPLRWMVLSVVLTLVVFLLPRLLIPVTFGYGTILRMSVPEPSQTMYFSEFRRLLAWPPELGTAVNILLALGSFSLPVWMLLTGPRARSLWQLLGPDRLLVVLWMATVLVLMFVGGSKTMVFATYASPIVVLVLGLLLRMEIGKAEMATALVGTVLFNRMIFSLGAQGAEPGPAVAFYGAYWHQLTNITAWRFAELSGWIAVAFGIRRFFGVSRRSSSRGTP